MAKFKFYLGTGYVGATHEEIVEVDVEGLNEEEKEKEVEEEFQQWMWEHLDTYWEEIK